MPRLELVRKGIEKRSTNRTSKGRFVKRRTVPINLTVSTRRQTPTEARKCTAALDLLVTEIVCHELSRVRSNQL
jgi:hypothetical protein